MPNNIDPNVPEEYRQGIAIFADGGCPDNGNATSMYGSFKLYRNGVAQCVTMDGHLAEQPRFDWTDQEHNTSPLAECLTLIKVLDYVRDLSMRAVNQPLPLITILMDNKMVVGFGTQTMQAKEPHMKIARARITTHPALRGVTVARVPGTVMKKILGH